MAERWFGHLAEADERHVYFGSAYAFYVVKGGRMGGHDSRLLEVFYGNRPVDQTVETVSSGTGLPDIRTRFVVESGAALEYHRTERGTVFCLLTPARSEGFHRVKAPSSWLIIDRLTRCTRPLKSMPTGGP